MPPSALILLLASATNTSTISALVFEGDRFWAEQLIDQVEEELERSIGIVETSSSSELGDLILVAQRSDHSDVWIVLADRSEVAVVRPKDRTVLTRSLDPTITDYALAIATSELVRLLESRSGPIAEVGVGVGVRFAGGAGIEAAPKREGTLLLPAIGVALEVRRWITPIEPDLILTLRLPVARSIGGVDQVSYRRFGLAAGVGGSLVVGWVLLRAMLGFDVAFTQVQSEMPQASKSHTVYAVDAQLGIRLPLAAGFDLEATGGAAIALNPAEFADGERLVLKEGRWRGRASLALGWSTP